MRVESIWDHIDRTQYIVPENAYEVRSMPVPVRQIIEQAPCPPMSHFKPSWAGMLCRGRDHITNSIIKIATDDLETLFFRFMYANAQKHLVAMVKLMPLDGHGDIDFSLMTTSEADALQDMDIGFSIVVNEFVYSDEAIFRQTHAFALIMESKLYPGGIVGAMGQWHSSAELEPILGAMIQKKEAKEEAMKKKLPLAGSHEYVQQLMCDYPWMVQYMDVADFGIEKTKRTSSKGHGHGGDGTGMDDTEEAMEIEENIFDLLSTKRVELHMGNPAPNPGQAFIVKLQGGAWTKKNMGKEFDSFKCHAKDTSTKQWCNDIGMPWNFSCSISKYGEDGAHSLCHLWQARMSHLKSYYDDHQSIVGAMTHFTEEAHRVDTIMGSGNQAAIDRLESIRGIAS